MRLLLLVAAMCSPVIAGPKITISEKQALYGTSGVPDYDNRFVTNDDPRWSGVTSSLGGPGSSTDGSLAVFNGTSGNVVKELLVTTDTLVGRDTAGDGAAELITLNSDLSLNGSQVLGVVDASLSIAFTQLNNVTTNSLLGRDTAGTGVAEMLTLASDLAMTSNVLGVVDANLSLGYTQIGSITTDSLVGRDTAGTGSGELLTLDSDLAITAGVLGVVDANLTIDRSQIGSVTTDSLIGRDTAGTGAAETITLASDLALSSKVLGVVDANLSLTVGSIGSVTTDTLIGRDTAGTGAAELITLGTGMTLSGGVLAAVLPAEVSVDDIDGVLTGSNYAVPTNSTDMVTARRLVAHPGVAKRVVHVNLTGTNQNSFGLSSITDTGTGDVDITWTTAFSASTAMAALASANGSSHLCVVNNSATTTVTGFQCFNDATTLTDPTTGWYIAIYGDE